MLLPLGEAGLDLGEAGLDLGDGHDDQVPEAGQHALTSGTGRT